MEELAASLLATLPDPSDRAQLLIVLGIDDFDVFYDNDATQARIVTLFRGVGIPRVQVVHLRSHFRGKLCMIWDVLATAAVDAGCAFVLLIGDDVCFLTPGWKEEIEGQFAAVARRTGLPYGAACVAFRDVAYPCFPTFPVMHRIHWHVFGCLFPKLFINQHGDPFLFELYRRIGSAEFTHVASLDNTIGGFGDARYEKQQCNWMYDTLTRAVAKLRNKLKIKVSGEGRGRASRPPPEVLCLNVVVPSYRCDPSMLKTITQLRASSVLVSVQILVVVDNPSLAAARKDELSQLTDYSFNHLVRVQVNATNIGASASRNTGIASSCGDYVVLLDDDVVPDPTLLDAYVGAIQRHPSAKILVGLSKLPPPVTFAQKMIIASQMSFFYDVAHRMAHPPWGVTANLCVQGRTHPRLVWFSDTYPRTGGGEDVDYCFRVKDLVPQPDRTEAIVSVPEARVVHPFWTSILSQVVGWALGDVLCLSALPNRTFFAGPNWIEFLFFLFVYLRLFSPTLWLISYGYVCVAVVVLDAVMTACANYPKTPQKDPPWLRTLIALASSLPIMAQDVARLYSKLLRLKLTQLCMQMDWMDGRGHVEAVRFSLLVKNVVFLAMAAALLSDRPPLLALAVTLVLLLLPWWNASIYFVEREMLELVSRLPPLPFDLSPQPQRAPFVVLTFQRTGSNLLCGKLHNHPEIVMHNEVFNNAKIWTYHTVVRNPTAATASPASTATGEGPWPLVEEKYNVFTRDADPLQFLADLFCHAPTTKRSAATRAVGFKLFPDHWTRHNQSALQQLLADPRVKKILLRRENPWATYVSKLRSDKSGHYITRPLDQVPVEVDLPSFESFVEYYDACYAHYESLCQGQEVHRVSYEQLQDPATADATMRDVLRFLDVSPDVVPKALDMTVKQSTRPLSEGVVNYEQVVAAFRHHPKMQHVWPKTK